MDDSLPAFDELLRSARREAGLTQEELAERAGLSARAISNLERGVNRAPHRDTLDLLAKALGLPPEVRRHWERHRSRQAMRSPRQYRPDGTEQTPPSQLPVHLSSFLGRDGELHDVVRLLQTPSVRMLTLTGPGGIGKTRLAIAVAAQLRPDFPDGSCFVPLVSIAHPDLVVHSLVQALQLSEQANQSPVDTLIEFLRDRCMLLILDNFEHVLSAAWTIAMLLEACPAMSILVTSRTPLRLRGEHEYPLGPLKAEASLALFVQRSSSFWQESVLRDDHRLAILKICQRLDGLPLAIELAAARSRVLPPHALLKRLSNPLQLLTGGPRDLPTRQQTLRHTIAWSYDLLDSDSQQFFRYFCVFRGAWTLDAAEHLFNNAFEMITTLVESSLLTHHERGDGEPRYQMMETIRQYGLEVLHATGELNLALDHHARYFSEFVAHAASKMQGSEQVYWLDRLEADHNNILGALDWYLESNEVESGLKLAASLKLFWWMHGHLKFATKYFDLFLDRIDDGITPIVLADALTGAGIAAEWHDDLERASDIQEQAMRIWSKLPAWGAPAASGIAPWGFGPHWSLISLGNIALRHGDTDEALTRYQTALEVARELQNPHGEAAALLSRGNIHSYSGNLGQAIEAYQQSLDIARKTGEIWAISNAIGNLGLIMLAEGRFADARPLIKESIAYARKMGHVFGIAQVLFYMGELEYMDGDLKAAADYFAEAISIATARQDNQGLALATLGQALVSCAQNNLERSETLLMQSYQHAQSTKDIVVLIQILETWALSRQKSGKHEDAVLLCAVADESRNIYKMALMGIRRDLMAQQLDSLKKVVSEHEFNEWWMKGTSLSIENVVRCISSELN